MSATKTAMKYIACWQLGVIDSHHIDSVGRQALWQALDCAVGFCGACQCAWLRRVDLIYQSKYLLFFIKPNSIQNKCKSQSLLIKIIVFP